MNKKQKKEKKVNRITTKMQANLLLVFCVILGMLLALIGRIIYIGYTDGDRYKRKVLEQQSYISSEVAYERGQILDSNGLVLAVSKRVYNVVLDPKVILTNESAFLSPTVKALAEVFDMDSQEILDIINNNPNSQYYVVKKQVPLSQVEAFNAKVAENRNIRGVWFEDDFVREYPYENLASHVVGFMTSGNEGLTGVELKYNSILNGTNGRSYGYFDAELNLQKTVHPAIDGNTIKLTINANVQNIIQRYIDDFMDTVGSKNIGILLMNPNNGEIYAMASNNEYDLNNPRDLSAFYSEEELASMTDTQKMEALNKIWNNYCIFNTYEPGSVYKPFTVAAALEEGVISKSQEFNCTGYRTIAGWKIYCNAKYGHGYVSTTKALMTSCNCALMDLVASLGRSDFYSYQQRFGFGSKTEIDLPGEAKGILLEEKQLNASELATSSFGQSFNVTMIQMAAGFCSLVNGGTYYQPHVVKEILDSEGKVVETIEPVVVRQTISEDTSKFLREALYQTVTSGTGSRAAVAGYMIGGKTGTAQKLPRADKKYVVSFMSIVPADKPELVLYVVVDEPYDEQYSASSYYATTLTSKIMNEICPFFEIYPQGEIDYRIEYPEDDTHLDNENGAEND